MQSHPMHFNIKMSDLKTTCRIYKCLCQSVLGKAVPLYILRWLRSGDFTCHRAWDHLAVKVFSTLLDLHFKNSLFINTLALKKDLLKILLW